MVTRLLLAIGGLLLANASPSDAAPFSIQATLTGDIRAANPDDILVRVGIVGDTTSNQSFWTIDLDSPVSHPNMVLGGLFFNLAVDPTKIAFSNFSPASWQVSYNPKAKNAEGSGGAAFLFEAKDPPGTSNNITNAVNLTFSATLASGQFWSTAMFSGAPLADGDGIADAGAQIGAHLRSLSMAGCATCTSDSGFAAGNYAIAGTTAPLMPPADANVPEPSSLLLLGSGGAVLAGMARHRRQRDR